MLADGFAGVGGAVLPVGGLHVRAQRQHAAQKGEGNVSLRLGVLPHKAHGRGVLPVPCVAAGVPDGDVHAVEQRGIAVQRLGLRGQVVLVVIAPLHGVAVVASCLFIAHQTILEIVGVLGLAPGDVVGQDAQIAVVVVGVLDSLGVVLVADGAGATRIVVGIADAIASIQPYCYGAITLGTAWGARLAPSIQRDKSPGLIARPDLG